MGRSEKGRPLTEDEQRFRPVIIIKIIRSNTILTTVMKVRENAVKTPGKNTACNGGGEALRLSNHY